MQLRLQLFVERGFAPSVWILQAGVLLNFLGNGLVAPYLVIFLHEDRGIPLALAAAAPASGGILATTSGLLAGPLIDRLGPRVCLIAAMTSNAFAYASYTQVHAVWQAFAVALFVGLGTGVYGPSSQSLVTQLVSAEMRAAALSQQRISAVVGLSLGGIMGGLLVASGIPSPYTVLLWLDAATFLGFAALLLISIPNTTVPARAGGAGYGAALRDRRLLLLAFVNLTMVSCAIAPMLWMLPPFARLGPRVPAGFIGLIYAVNTVVILLAQLRITRSLAGRPAVSALAAAASIWAVAWLIVAGTGAELRGDLAALALGGAVAVYAIGECMYTAKLSPTAAAIAPAGMQGRYLAVTGFAWQAGFMIGPPLAGALLSLSPLAFPVAEAGVCGILAVILFVVSGRLTW